MSTTALAETPVTPGFQKATSQLSTVLGIEPRMMVESLKKQCFPGMRPEEISDAQLAAFISVANAMGLNPLIPGMLYAYPGKNGGIIPVCGPDGVLKKLDEAITSGKLDGYECEVFPVDVALKPTHAVAKIFRTGKDHPSTFTAIFGEWVVNSNPNWNSRPRHMIWLRAIKQCARQVIHGVPFDEDDLVLGDMKNVTPQPEPPTSEQAAAARATPKPRSPKGAAAAAESQKPAIDVQTVPPKTETAAGNVSQPPAEKTVEPAAPPKTVEKQAEPAPATETKVARTDLKEKEELVAVCVVEKIFSLYVNVVDTKTPSVQATVKGEFTGTVFHFGGATIEGDQLVPAPEWKVGGSVRLSLFGRLNTKSGKVMNVVKKIESAEGSSDTTVDVG